MTLLNNDTIPEITLDGFQVVSADMFRRAFRLFDPSMTLWNNSICFSKAAVTALNNCARIRIEVNTMAKKILIAPVTSNDKDGIKWLQSGENPSARKIECIQFASQLYKLWGFDPKRTYRAPGKIVAVERKIMVMFDFSEPESWNYKEKAANDKNI
nr:hypothetical protein [Lachnospiraceae bacterium]